MVSSLANSTSLSIFTGGTSFVIGGSSTSGNSGGLNSSASLGTVSGIVATSNGNIYTANYSTNNIRLGLPVPSLQNPGTQTALQDTSFFFSSATGNSLAVRGNTQASPGGTLSMTLRATNGVLNLGGSAADRAALASVSGNGTAEVTVSGTAAQINAVLEFLAYTPNAGYYNTNGSGAALLSPATLTTSITGNGATVSRTLNLLVADVTPPVRPTVTSITPDTGRSSNDQITAAERLLSSAPGRA